jgi:hypothetical protein
MPDRIHDYDLERPTATDLVASLTQILGPETTRGLLDRALRELGIKPDDLPDLSSAQTLMLAKILSKERGLPSILARSFSIRLRTYEQLSSRVQLHAGDNT